MFGPGSYSPRGECSGAPRERVGLVVGGCPPEALAEIQAVLEREGYEPALLARERPRTSVAGHRRPAVVVLWLADPSLAAASAAEGLAERFGDTPVVVVCASIERRQLRALLAAEVVGVVVSDELEGSLGVCVRAVRAGQLCVPRSHWREIEPAVLSVRERQVLGLVAMGYMNRQIADRLFLAESTVKSHLSSAFGKLGVHSRSEAAELILSRERGLAMEALELGGEPQEQLAAVALSSGAR